MDVSVDEGGEGAGVVLRICRDKAFYLTRQGRNSGVISRIREIRILFHAHYTVRIVSWDRVMHPLMISASLRMSACGKFLSSPPCGSRTSRNKF